MSTISKLIEFHIPMPSADGVGLLPQAKTITIKKLDRFDPSQSKITMKLRHIHKIERKDGQDIVTLDPDKSIDIVQDVLDKLIIIDDNFTQKDLNNLRSDNFAFIAFVEWYIREEAWPFILPFYETFLK